MLHIFLDSETIGFLGMQPFLVYYYTKNLSEIRNKLGLVIPYKIVESVLC